MEEKFFNIVKTTVDDESDFLNNIGQEIWKHPELKYEETFAHEFLTDILLEKGFSVKKQYILPTAFLAEYDSKRSGPTVAVVCEYDALPKIGHACGHNLIAEAGVGAAIAMKAAMESSSDIPGKIVVLGTPAEEEGGGKIHLINAGVFDNIDVALMVHPTPNDSIYPFSLSISEVTITYFGKETHACRTPWEGINALDAVVASYVNLSLLRQQIKPTSKIHCIITKGGDTPNMIPGCTEMQLCYRAASTSDKKNLKHSIYACIKSAADSTGCKYEIKTNSEMDYECIISNKQLAEAYKKYSEMLGVHYDDKEILPFMASSDMGNVSHVVPSIHPLYSIGTKAGNHSAEFAEACITSYAQSRTMICSKSLAMLGLKVLVDQEFLNQVKKEFDIVIKENVHC